MESDGSSYGSQRRNFLKAIGGTVGVSSVAGCIDNIGGGDDGGAPGTVRIGLPIPTSGAYGFLGDDFELGFDMRKDSINDSDDVLPETTIETVSADTGSDPEEGLSAARRLVLEEGADMLVGGANSQVVSSVANFASEENVPYFIGLGTTKAVTTGEKCKITTARIASTTEVNPKILPTYAVNDLDLKKGYSLLPDYSIGYQMQEIVPATVDANGGEIVQEKLVPVGKEDWGTIINDIQSSDADFLFVGVAGSGLIPFLTQAANRGVDIPIFINFFFSPTAGALTQQQVEDLPGLYRAAYYTREISTPENEEFRSAFMEQFDRPPIYPNGFGYMNANFVAEALSDAGTVETDQFMESVEGLTWDDLVGTIRIRECDHQGLPPIHLTRYTGVENELGTNEVIKRYPADDLEEQFVTLCEEAACSFDQ